MLTIKQRSIVRFSLHLIYSYFFMGYYVEIIFGKEQVLKYRQRTALSDYENLVNRKRYEFESLLERNAFYKGLSESQGLIKFEIIKEFKTTSAKDEETKFDYWDFIEKYYPNYNHCDNVLLSDILTRKLNGEEICENDEEYIKNWDIRKVLIDLDKQLLSEAFENFINTLYPELK